MGIPYHLKCVMDSSGPAISHHGIKGQQWGVKNGPPYPLDKGTHAAVVAKSVDSTSGVNLKRTSDGKSNGSASEGEAKATNKGKSFFEQHKKAIIAGAAVAVVAVGAVAAAKYFKDHPDQVPSMFKHDDRPPLPEGRCSIDSLREHFGTLSDADRDPDKIMNDVNPDGGLENCYAITFATFLRDKYGIDVKANPKLHPAATNLIAAVAHGKDAGEIDQSNFEDFVDVIQNTFTSKGGLNWYNTEDSPATHEDLVSLAQSLSDKICSKYKDGARGGMLLNGQSGHIVNWYVEHGQLVIRDGQGAAAKEALTKQLNMLNKARRFLPFQNVQDAFESLIEQGSSAIQKMPGGHKIDSAEKIANYFEAAGFNLAQVALLPFDDGTFGDGIPREIVDQWFM